MNTRASRQPTHLLHTPDTFVRTPMPSITRGTAIVHASPALGAAFLMYTVELEPGGTLAQAPRTRFLYLLAGQATIAQPAGHFTVLPGHYAYAPSAFPLTLTAVSTTIAFVIEKVHEPLPAFPPSESFIRRESDLIPAPLIGPDNLPVPSIQVQSLIPPDLNFDLAINIMTYNPGAQLPQVEIHYMEHGLLMLAGSGPYRLGDHTYQTQTGDVIWMAPYCPQWFQADPQTPAKYLIYKNFNRLPTL